MKASRKSFNKRILSGWISAAIQNGRKCGRYVSESTMHDFIGKWRIAWMEAWPQDYIDLGVSGYFEFTEENLGEFKFGAMRGWLDVRVSDSTPMLEFS